MKKVVSILMVYSVFFMGFAITPQGVSLNANSGTATPQGFDALPFEAELGTHELAQVEGERRRIYKEAYKRGKQVVKAVRDGAIYDGAKKGAKSANKRLTKKAKETGRKCRTNPRRCAD